MANAFFPYPGGKAQYAEWIIDRFPKHECYVEVFGGGAGVLYHKPRSTIEVYNDLHADVWNFFDTYQRRTDELVDRLKSVYYAEEQYEEWKDTAPEDEVDQAARFFFMRYANWGSSLEMNGFRRMKHRSTADQFCDAVESLPDKAERLHRVTIERLDWSEAVDKYDGDDTLFYFDPPYVDVGDNSDYDDNDIYQLESTVGTFDHDRFVSALSDVDGDWAVSYDKLPDTEPEYVTQNTRSTSNSISNGQFETKDRTERLLMNYDPDERDTFVDKDQASVDAFV